MDLAEIEQELRTNITMGHSLTERPSKQSMAEAVQRQIQRLPRPVRKELTDRHVAYLIQAVYDDIIGFGPLQALLDDPAITEIMVLETDVIYIEKEGVKQRAQVRFRDAGHVMAVVERMMSSSGRRLDESNPYVDFALDDGSRVHVIIPPLAERCGQITVRKFLDTIRNIDDLVRFGTLDQRMADFLVACMRSRKNLLFSGATGSGKTTTLSALSFYIDEQERILSIEDTRELQLRQEHVVYLVTRPPNIEGKGEVTLRDLVRNTLRMRPSRILLGEIRGPESLDFLQALNSGHDGCSAVLHASTPHDAISRLETLAMFSGVSLPVSAIRSQIASGLDIIIQQAQMIDGGRRITHISEVQGMEGDQVKVQDLFRYELMSTDEAGRTEGRFLAVAPPADLSYFSRRGIPVAAAWFEEE